MALHIDALMAVHHDVADRRILQQRLQWTQSEDFIENFFDEALAFGDGHRKLLFLDYFLDNVTDLLAHAVLVERAELLGR